MLSVPHHDIHEPDAGNPLLILNTHRWVPLVLEVKGKPRMEFEHFQALCCPALVAKRPQVQHPENPSYLLSPTHPGPLVPSPLHTCTVCVGSTAAGMAMRVHPACTNLALPPQLRTAQVSYSVGGDSLTVTGISHG
jgi:hypothetical protein